MLRSNNSKRHVKSVKIGASLFLLTMATFMPITYDFMTQDMVSAYSFFVIYSNYFANFFIYFWIPNFFSDENALV